MIGGIVPPQQVAMAVPNGAQWIQEEEEDISQERSGMAEDDLDAEVEDYDDHDQMGMYTDDVSGDQLEEGDLSRTTDHQG